MQFTLNVHGVTNFDGFREKQGLIRSEVERIILGGFSGLS